jgi:hypothetical protein
MDKLEIDVHMNRPEFDKYVKDRLVHAQSGTLSGLIQNTKTLPFAKTTARKHITYNNRMDYPHGNYNGQKPKLKQAFVDVIETICRDYSKEQLFNTLVRDNGFWDFEATKIHLT